MKYENGIRAKPNANNAPNTLSKLSTRKLTLKTKLKITNIITMLKYTK